MHNDVHSDAHSEVHGDVRGDGDVSTNTEVVQSVARL